MQSVLHGSLETLVFNTKDSVEIPMGSLPMQVPNTVRRLRWEVRWVRWKWQFLASLDFCSQDDHDGSPTRDHQDFTTSHGRTPSSEIWEPTTSHWTKQLISCSEPLSMEADVYVWRYALLVVHTSEEEENGTRPPKMTMSMMVRWQSNTAVSSNGVMLLKVCLWHCHPP